MKPKIRKVKHGWTIDDALGVAVYTSSDNKELFTGAPKC